MRGFFTIGIWHPKCEHNIGTLWRSAWQLGAAEIFVVAPRWPTRQASDTTKAWRHLPYRKYTDMEHLVSSLPYSTPLIGVEQNGTPMGSFVHPQRACYLLGAEDHGLSDEVQEMCAYIVSLQSVRTNSYNVAVAGSLLMYDRMYTSGQGGM